MHKFKQACVGILVSLLCSNVVMANDAPVAVITGSSYGLGAELVDRAVARGWRIAMVDYRPGPSATKAQEIKERGGQAAVFVADLSEPEDRKGLIKEVLKTFGRVDYLFNNAGYAYLATVEQMKLQSAHRLFEVNYWAYADLAKQVIEPMRKQGGGTIVNVSSILGTVAAPAGYGHYSASKHALHGLFQAMVKEVAPDNIKVFLAAPGGMKTQIGAHSVGPLANPEAPVPANWEDPGIVADDIFEAIKGESGVFMPGYVGRQGR
ncbi:SDR family NAD(P)-dependent oxidoreductase [Aequoribacter sp.]|jgi:NAD(P)-dependent dehydrogenase (short-subunit alcohol dehydrogenase family)|uniref:SDR family NAD(P)-dependent oxidoreductase n=2 Tax=Aequoribacter sp. TaxID=2847771 RepID=UPI003C552CE3